MGQAASTWCHDGDVDGDSAPTLDLQFQSWVPSEASSRQLPAEQAAGRTQNGSTGTLAASSSSDAVEVQRLFNGLPRELASTLEDTGQWPLLRCRPWLSAGATRGLQRNLQLCQLRQCREQFKEAESLEDCTHSLPACIPWSDLDVDHVVSAGQTLRMCDIPTDKHAHLRRIGLQTIRQGRVAVALLAGGASFRLGMPEGPVGCMRSGLRLQSGKSILQLCCERVRRIAALCATAGVAAGIPNARPPSIPVVVMTSRLTHRAVMELFEANSHFGLPKRDVFFFEQPVQPVLGYSHLLLPQSLSGEFAHAPGGSGPALQAMARSSALEQLKDRGVEYLHIVGTENLLAKVCDPVFVGFCRDLDLDCTCKVVERTDVAEDLELFCVRQGLVSTQFADIEEAACGLEPSEAPSEVLNMKDDLGALSYSGSINSFFVSLAYVEEVVGRPLRQRKVSRPVPYLDFFVEADPEVLPPLLDVVEEGLAEVEEVHRQKFPTSGVPLGSWPAEASSPDFACQRALMAASADVRRLCQLAPEDTWPAWRCDVHLDCRGPQAVVRVRTAQPGPLLQPQSLQGPNGAHAVLSAIGMGKDLLCSLVIPRTPNAWVLETSLLDYFAFTDRAMALKVTRASEFAPIRASSGRHSPENARRAMHLLHCSWLSRASVELRHPPDEEAAMLEVSPLLSYEGEDVLSRGQEGEEKSLQLPCQMLAIEEEITPEVTEDSIPKLPSSARTGFEDAPEGLDTRPFYLQEYPRRPQVSCSHQPKFLNGPGGGLLRGQSPPAVGRGSREAPVVFPPAGILLESMAGQSPRPGAACALPSCGLPGQEVPAVGRGAEEPVAVLPPATVLGLEPTGDQCHFPGL